MDQPWLNMDQRGSAAFSVLTHGACVRKNMYPKSHFWVHIILAHASCLMAHASHASRLTPHASRVRRHDSCVRRHASGVMRHASCVRRHGSCVRRPRVRRPRVRRHASGVHASGVMRPRVRRPASCVMRRGGHSAPRHGAGGISHRLDPLGQCPRNAFH